MYENQALKHQRAYLIIFVCYKSLIYGGIVCLDSNFRPLSHAAEYIPPATLLLADRPTQDLEIQTDNFGEKYLGSAHTKCNLKPTQYNFFNCK